MKRNWIQVVLFVLLACAIVDIAAGGVNATSFWSSVLFAIGFAMIGGLACSLGLYGVDFVRRERSVEGKHFVRIGRNRDMGEDYWIEFIDDLCNDERTVWFVGNRQGTWIDPHHPYRKALQQQLLKRVARALEDGSEHAWSVVIILSERDAAASWLSFLEDDINRTTQYRQTRTDLIRVGIAGEEPIRYSIVAYGKGMVITPYTSRGLAADSPTFQVQPKSEVAELYTNDLKRIRDGVKDSDWLIGAPEPEGALL